jgi:3-hydroxyacyl-[acyl-carrier-protein] dehydratase
VVECVHRSALATAPVGPIELICLESARFVGAVYPDDTIDIGIQWRTKGADLVCAAVVTSPRGEAATVRLRYRPSATRDFASNI